MTAPFFHVEYLASMPTGGSITEEVATAICSELGSTQTVTDCSVTVVGPGLVSFFVTYTADSPHQARAACVRARGVIDYPVDVVDR